MSTHQRPQFLYIARACCGCCHGVFDDDTSNKASAKATAGRAADFIKDGYSIERVPFGMYQAQVSQEAGFMGCAERDGCVRRKPAQQESLL